MGWGGWRVGCEWASGGCYSLARANSWLAGGVTWGCFLLISRIRRAHSSVVRVVSREALNRRELGAVDQAQGRRDATHAPPAPTTISIQRRSLNEHTTPGYPRSEPDNFHTFCFTKCIVRNHWNRAGKMVCFEIDKKWLNPF